MLSVLLFQVSNLPQVQTAVESTGTQNLWSVLLQTGYLGIANIFINLVLSVIAIYIFVDRYRSLKRASNVDENFMNNIRNSVQNGNIDAAKIFVPILTHL